MSTLDFSSVDAASADRKLRCFLVSHTHWDREWYRTFQSFRARLVDVLDALLDQIAADPGTRFQLDGQAILLEDYLALRPERRSELERACGAGQIAAGPWYVQPDSLLPSGEAHVRNLLEGRRVARAFGAVSTVAYCPDSFGHPAQFPQLFAGFGLEPFVHWRGSGDEVDRLPSEYRWEAPDGSGVVAHHLSRGYFAASCLPEDPEEAAQALEALAHVLVERANGPCVLLMNGVDHAFPDPHSEAVAKALEARTGWKVERALLDDFAAALSRPGATYRGDLLGARSANVHPGVWSTRIPLKLRNRRCEALLEGWAESWGALGRLFGAPDERASLRTAWRALLQNQPHDSICGCSIDRVHEQMLARYEEAEELAEETCTRALERVAGLGPRRATPWTDVLELAVFNPSPHPRTDVVRFALDPFPFARIRGDPVRGTALHPLFLANATAEGFTVDGAPARVLDVPASSRVRLPPDASPREIEFVVENVPPFGWRRVHLAPSRRHASAEDRGTEIAVGELGVIAARDGSLSVRFGERIYGELCGIEDLGDRGDAYDFEAVAEAPPVLEDVDFRRGLHPNGIQTLRVRRRFRVPAELAPEGDCRSQRTVPLEVVTSVRLAPGVRRVDLAIRVENAARDHRLRLLFPTGEPASECLSATTFDIARRGTARHARSGWVQAVPPTFPHQGFVHANGLTLVAPGLPEAEVTPEGVIALTLVRAVGWLARLVLPSRPLAAGWPAPAPGAQCLGRIEAPLALLPGLDARAARDAELGLRAVAAGGAPLVDPMVPLVEIEPREALLSALKPAEDGSGLVLRLLNPQDEACEVRIRLGFSVAAVRAVRLDEEPVDAPLELSGDEIALRVPPHALRSLAIEAGRTPGAQAQK